MIRFSGKKNRIAILSASLLAGVGLFALSIPADGQESILPPGFGQPEKAQPKSDSRPKSEPKQKAESPKAEPKSDSRPKSDDGRDESPAPVTPSFTSPVASGDGGDRPSAPRPRDGAASSSDASREDGEQKDANDEIVRVRKYDLPAGSRRSLDRIGPLTEADGGLGENAFWGAGGNYLSVLMDKTNAPLVSRWGSILLRRTLVSSVKTPTTINGADFAASRASLLVRMGEADAARAVIQSVDPDKATSKLLEAAMATYPAAADPAGLCSLVPMGLQKSKDGKWDLARGICTALSGDAGTAGVIVDRALRQKKAEPIDVRLAEKILGASANGRRAVKIEWDGITNLTPWRFGLATATGVEVPETLYKSAGSQFRSWAALAPMTSMNQRVAFAPWAAQSGVLSNAAYVDLVSSAFDDPERSEKVSAEAELLRDAYTGSTLGDRLTAIKQIWANADKMGTPYAGDVVTARAAARLPVTDQAGDDAARLIASMLTAGLDVNAAAWAPVLPVGSRGWALLALAAPQPLKNVDAGTVGDFIGDDESADYLSSKILVAGLAGLGRIDQDALNSVADDLEMNFNRKSDWALAIEKAAADGQTGTVALLAAVGLQGSGWDKMSPAHIYYITKALSDVGLNAEARMIAAEAVART